jgi:hypothetical protein
MKAHTKVALAAPVIAGLVGGLGLGTGLKAVPAAHADTYGSVGDHDKYSFMYELHSVGMSGTPDSARNLANIVCGKRAEGYTESRVIEYAENPPDPMPKSWAVEVVHGAEYHFCPQYLGGTL